MIKVWTRLELLEMDQYEFQALNLALNVGALSLLGIKWDKYWKIHQDPITLDVVLEYE